LTEGYKEFATYNGLNFIKNYIDFRKYEAIAFDIDGTLIDSRVSYNETIYQTVSMFYQWVVGFKPPKDEINSSVAKLRLTGGFNNDWDTAYTILIGLYSGFPDEILKILSSTEYRFFKDYIKVKMNKESLIETSIKALNYLLMYADSKGLQSIEEGLKKLYNRKEKLNYLIEIKNKLNYPNLPGKSLLSTVFDEIYLGMDLFKEMWQAEPVFKLKKGLIEDEKVVLENDVKTFLKKKFGNKIGIASGRPKKAAIKTLKDLLGNFFNPESSFFIDDAYVRSKEQWLGKPNSFLIEQVIKSLKVKSCLYVGDSYEDVLMVKNTRKLGYEVGFVGVYGFSLDMKNFIQKFMEADADAILPSVNDLKFLF